MVRAAAPALVLTLVLALPALAQDGLVAGRPWAVVLAPGQPVRLPIDAPPGSYIAGRIQAGDVALDADLLDGSGAHVRRLALDAPGDTGFYALTQGQGMMLQLGADRAGTVQVQLDQSVPPQAQVAPPAYDSPRIAALAESLAAGAGTDGFWREVAAQGTPLVEPAADGQVVMTFLWRGAQRNVRLFGGPSNDHEWLERLGDSDVWFKSFTVPPTTRLSYRLAPDVPDVPGDARARRVAILATAQADPLNRTPWPANGPDRFNTDSMISLPGAPEQPGTPPLPQADPVIETMAFDSPTLGNRREVTIARPRDLDPADPRLVTLLLFDGERAQDRMDAPRVIDTLTRTGRLPPVVAVLIPSIDAATRSRELPGNDRFADALADELMPALARRLGRAPDPARTVVAGVSYGGLASATVALRRPEVFGNAIALSGSFWWSPDGTGPGLPHVAAQVARGDRRPVRFFISAGSFETARGDGRGILETSAILRDVLRIRGYDVTWREYAGGHDDLIWRGALADGLIALFGQEFQRVRPDP